MLVLVKMMSNKSNNSGTVYTVTSVPVSPEDDLKSRLKKYSIAMAIRTGCVALLVVVDGWMLFVVALGAIFLPYFAVVIANAQEGRAQAGTLESPTQALPSEKII